MIAFVVAERGARSAFDPAPGYAVSPAEDVELPARRIAGQRRRLLHEMNEGPRTAALPAIGAINEAAQLPQSHHHSRYDPAATAAHERWRPKAVEALEQPRGALDA